ncbi:hypothetical protein KKG41_02295 [Patescibacteria group bacterium]|nr:hypothetical protein [Patescibacteria group bacterium]MBU1890414.1 hypothetical protein [Patescibacteria group bacterium]
MFNFKNKKEEKPKKEEPFLDAEVDIEKEENVIQADVQEDQIRTMPSKFLTNHKGGQGSKKDNWTLYIILLVVFIVLIAGAILLFNRIIKTDDSDVVENQNTNENVNQVNTGNENINENTNLNTNTGTVDSLAETLISKSDLGNEYEDYEESDTETDVLTLSSIEADRVRKVFTYEVADKDNISIEVVVLESDSTTNSLAIYEINREKRNRQISALEGEFQDHDKIGSDSYLYLDSDISVIEQSFYWKYLYATILINIRQGVLTDWDAIEKWSEQIFRNLKDYDTNRPEPVNDNSNVNINSNANTNANSNSNTNINSNVNISVTPPPSSADQDEDGLTDIEEIMYGTEEDKPDTDGDSFTDGDELMSGYNPLSGSGTQLESSGIVKVFTSQLYNYRALYPTSWIVQNTSFDGTSVAFTSSTSEFIEILIEDNPERLSPKQWYLSHSPGVDSSEVEDIIVGDLIGVKSLDGLTAYLGKENVIYVLMYNIGNRDEASFFATFNMFINSFISTGTTTLPESDCAEGVCNTNTIVNGNSNTNINENTNTNTNTNENVNSNEAVSNSNQANDNSNSVLE